METDLTFEEIKASSDAELARRMKLFRYWTSIVPQDNASKHRSWYISKRNRGRKAILEHHDQVLEGVKNYTHWLEDQRDPEHDGTVIKEDPRANPDVLPYVEPVENEQRNLLRNQAAEVLPKIQGSLTGREYTVFARHMNGRSVTEIAKELAITHQVVSKILAKGKKKVAKLFGEVR